MNNISKQKADNDLIGDRMESTFSHVVDYIAAKRVGLNGKVEYLVKWEGWSLSSATWEPPANFASPQIVEIFENGVKQQTGDTEEPFVFNESTSGQAIGSLSKTKCSSKRKSKLSEPMATKFCEDFRKRSKKRKKENLNKDISPRKLFDIEVNRIESVIKRYEPLVGASKRKSRMSCPSSPIKKKVSPKSVPLSQRSQRYQMRNQLNSDNSLSNTSLEENKNPSNENSKVISNLNTTKNSIKRKRRMKVNNDSNKIIKLSQNLSEMLNDLNNESQDVLEDSPSKVFINKVKVRLSSSPDVYKQFLNEIIDFQSINLEFSRLLNNNDELIRGFFDFLSIGEEPQTRTTDQLTTIYPTKTYEEIDVHVSKWMKKVDRILENKDKTKFWDYIQNKQKNDILKASPDHLWLRINSLLTDHRDLCEEFKTFMPTLCSKIYSLFQRIQI